jgi:CheY-like chemotaxis protein
MSTARRGQTRLKHILVADDDPSIRVYLSHVLETAGYRVTEVDDGYAALTMLTAESEDFDALVSDCGMPLMSGPEVLSRLRAAGSSLPVLLMSGSELPESIPEPVGEPAVAYLPKPFLRQEVLDAVAALIGIAP